MIESLPRNEAAVETRLAIREGLFDQHTGQVAPGNLQGNVVILPAAMAEEFESFCRQNPSPCPLVAVSDRGDPILPALGAEIDIRTDVPRYRVFHEGQLTAEVTDIVELWTEDLVTFVLGCSFSFEKALTDEGISVRHLDEDVLVPMFRSSIATSPAGRFEGSMVVTMRPIPSDQVERAVQITEHYPYAHGGPVHIGSPHQIGILDIGKPTWGDAVTVYGDEVPVFWGCGVTSQLAIGHALPPICITHAPGHMLVTDLFCEPVGDSVR